MLNLYRNITPNLSGTHYYFKDFSKYLTLLASNLFKEIDETRYDINKGFIRVKLGTDVTEANYKEVTYIINTTDNMSYHVSSQIIQSGYAYYGVNVDLWASYIVNAKLKNINVKKCNRKLSDNGIYDDIKNNNNIRYQAIGNATLPNSDMYAIFSIKAPPSAGVNKPTHYNIVIALTELYRIAPRVFFSLPDYKYFYQDGVTLVSNISNRATELHLPSLTHTDIEVENVWLVTNEMIDLSYATAIDYLQFSGSPSEETRASGYLLWSSYKEKSVLFNYDINNDYKIGTKNDGINILRKIDNNIEAKYIFTLDMEGFKGLVSIGSKQRDITTSFRVTFPTDTAQNRSIETQLKRIALALIPTTINPLKYIGGIAKTGISIAGDEEQQAPSQLGGIGDAQITYYLPKNEYEVSNPFILSVSTSIENESKRARKTGANFNEYIDELEDIFNYSLLGTGEVNDDTFIVASLDANEIPTSAVDLIEGRFASGVYLHYLQ